MERLTAQNSGRRYNTLTALNARLLPCSGWAFSYAFLEACLNPQIHLFSSQTIVSDIIPVPRLYPKRPGPA